MTRLATPADRELGEAAGLLVALTEAMHMALDDPPDDATDDELVNFAINQATSIGTGFDGMVSERAWQHAQKTALLLFAYGVLDLVRMERDQL